MRRIIFRKRFVHLMETGQMNSTIRAFKKPFCVYEQFIPCAWSELPYQSRQVIIGAPITIHTVMDFRKIDTSIIVDGVGIYGRPLAIVALNCGFTSITDFLDFFPFEYVGKIYIWRVDK